MTGQEHMHEKIRVYCRFINGHKHYVMIMVQIWQKSRVQNVSVCVGMRCI